MSEYTYSVMEWPADQPPPPFPPIILRSDGAQIPSDPENTDYQAYLEWAAENPDPPSARHKKRGSVK